MGERADHLCGHARRPLRPIRHNPDDGSGTRIVRASALAYTWEEDRVTPAFLLRVIWFVSFYFLTVLVLPLVVGGAVTYRALPSGRACPRCQGTSILLRARFLSFLSRVPFIDLQRRWCLSCGWLGVVRVPRPSVRLVLAGRSREPAEPRITDVRRLLVDGVSWGVRLETWKTGRLWYGRLLFVEKTGRLWSDARPLCGTTSGEVLDQARRLPPDLLVSRLRELVSG